MPETEANGPGAPALVYCRISKKEQRGRGASLDSQRDTCAAHAESLGYRVTRVTREVHTGADLFGRPLLARDRADIRAGRFRAVIAYSVDRLTRSEAHLAILAAEFDRAGCRLIFADGDPADAASRRDEAYAADVERRMIAERMRRSRLARLRQGRPTFAGWDLYGYRADRGRAGYAVYEPEAEIVRRVFSLRAAGRGMHSIASLLNGEGVPAPKAAFRPGARWRSSTISKLLNCRSYKGEEYRRETPSGGGAERPLPESDWIKLPDGVRPPVVPPELWDECQRRIRARAAGVNNKGSRPALLRGHLFCSECGAVMRRNRFTKGEYEYEKYRCASRWWPYDTGCWGGAVAAAAVEEWAWAAVEEIVGDEGALTRALVATRADEQLTADLETAKMEHERAGRGLDALLSLVRSDPSLLPHVGREASRAAREKGELEKVIAELECRMGESLQRAADLKQVLDLCAQSRDDLDRFTFEERRLTLRALGYRAYANGDDPARWRYEAVIASAGA